MQEVRPSNVYDTPVQPAEDASQHWVATVVMFGGRPAQTMGRAQEHKRQQRMLQESAGGDKFLAASRTRTKRCRIQVRGSLHHIRTFSSQINNLDSRALTQSYYEF